MVTNGYSWAETFQTQPVCMLSCLVVSIFVTLWTVAHQAPLPMGFPRQEYWSGLSFPSPGDQTQGSNPHLLHPLYLLHCRQILYYWATREVLSDTISSVQLLSRVQLFAIPWTAARQASLSITNSRSSPKPMSIESMMPSNHLSSVVPFSSHLQTFPESGSFPMSQFFASSGQSTGFIFNISSSNEYSGMISFRIDWFELLAVQETTLKSLL